MIILLVSNGKMLMFIKHLPVLLTNLIQVYLIPLSFICSQFFLKSFYDFWTL